MEWLIEIVLVGLLAATLYHALRLERALGVLKRDRSALEELVSGFTSSTRVAEQGIERLRQAADGAGRHIARQIETAQSLRDDSGIPWPIAATGWRTGWNSWCGPNVVRNRRSGRSWRRPRRPRHASAARQSATCSGR